MNADVKKSELGEGLDLEAAGVVLDSCKHQPRPF